MIYLIEDESTEATVAMLDGPDDLNMTELFDKFKEEWKEGMEYNEDHLIDTQEAGAYLEKYRQEYANRIQEKGTPINCFISHLMNKHHCTKRSWVHAYLEDD